MKHIKWYTWVGIGLVFFFLTISIGKLTVYIQDVVNTEAIAVEVKSTQIETGIRMETETKEAESFTSVKNIPYTEIKAIDVPIHQWAQEKEEAFFEEMETTESSLSKNIQAHFSLQSNVIKLDDHIFTVKMELIQSVDQENEYVEVKTFTFNNKEEELITFKDIVNPSISDGETLVSLLNTYTNDELNEDQINDYVNHLEDLSWMIQDEQITFYFNQGDISDQNVQINIPLTAFYTFLTDDYYDILITEELEAEIASLEEERKAEEERRRKEALASKKLVALTFDDGPSATVTERILQTLNQYDAKATFYMLSQNVAAYPDLAKKIADQGHEIANHSETHANLNAISRERAKEEVVASQTTIRDITGVEPKTFRPPYGNYNSNTVELVEQSNQSIVLWSVDTLDWQSLNADAVYQQVVNHTVSGSIVLMHDIHATTADALPSVMEYLKTQGFEFVTVSELMPFIEGDGIGPYYGN